MPEKITQSVARILMSRIAETAYLMPRKPWHLPEPGQYYERLSEDDKAVLRTLTSDDVADMRPL
jgi:hypothetical protein